MLTPNSNTPSPLIVSTSLASLDSSTARGLAIAKEIGANFVPRDHLPLPKLLALYSTDRAVIVEGGNLCLSHEDGSVYHYHPNLGFVRALNLLADRRDPYIEAAALKEGQRVLDCTLGFASEAILASMVVGESGRVVGLESVPELAILTREGLRERRVVQKLMMEAMRRIEVIPADYRDYLPELALDEFDAICFDPFFHERTRGSEININPLLRFGNPAPLDVSSVLRAMQLARRVVIKHPRDVELPEPLPALRTEILTIRRRPVAYSVFVREDLA